MYVYVFEQINIRKQCVDPYQTASRFVLITISSASIEIISLLEGHFDFVQISEWLQQVFTCPKIYKFKGHGQNTRI